MVKNPPANVGAIRMRVRSLGLEDPLEEGMATHSSILAQRILWTEEPSRLWSMGPQNAGHDKQLSMTQHSGYARAYVDKCNAGISGLEKPGPGRNLGQHDLPHITQKAPAAGAAGDRRWSASLLMGTAHSLSIAL